MSNFCKNMIEFLMKPNILIIYHKCPYGGKNQNPILMKGISC